MSTSHFVFHNGQLIESKKIVGLVLEKKDDQTIISIANDVEIKTPLHFTFLSDENSHSFQHTISIGENSHVKFFAEFIGKQGVANYISESSLKFFLKKNAHLDYYKLQNENVNSTHFSNISVEQCEASIANLFFLDCGSQKTQRHLRVHLNEAHAACHLHGLYFLNQDKQAVENHLHVDHVAPFGTSSMLFKGVLDKKSRASFHGKVHVRERAQHTTAHQANHNLLLSNHAEVSTQPQLEIDAEEIKCSHGATVGQLDQDSLFYLRSRGIEKSDALKLLTDAFIADIMNKIEESEIRQHFLSRVAQYE